MRRKSVIGKVLFVAALVLLGGVVLADALPDQSTLVVTSGGTPIASGTYVGGDLTMNVVWTQTDGSTSWSGATLTVTTRGGDTLTYPVDVAVDGDGNVTVTLASGQPLQSLNPSILARGGTVTLGTADAYTAPQLPSPGPNSHANANAWEHAANATEGMNNASDAATGGSGGSHANGRASDGSGGTTGGTTGTTD